MKDMAYTQAELTEKAQEYKGDNIGNMPKYPWGLELRLGDEVIKKLGTQLPDVGGKVLLMAEAVVTGKNARQEADGDTKASVELQIVAMQVGPEAPKEQSEVMFGK